MFGWVTVSVSSLPLNGLSNAFTSRLARQGRASLPRPDRADTGAAPGLAATPGRGTVAVPPRHSRRERRIAPVARFLVVPRSMMAWMRGPGRWPLVVMFALGCGGSDTGGGGGGCGSEDTSTCDIDPESTACGDRIVVVCVDGGTPDASSQCEKALEESGEALYCCTSAAEQGEAQGATTDAATTGAATTDAATTGAATTDAATTGAGGDDGAGGSA